MRRMLVALSAVILVSGACSSDSSSTETVMQAEPTSPPGTDAGEADLLGVTSDELCEALPSAEIGVVISADAQVTTFGGGPGVMCDVGISFPGTTVHVVVDLLNRGGEEGFEEGVDREATLFNLDPIDIAGVGDAAAGFNNGMIIVLSGQSVVRIGGFPEELVNPEVEEIGRLIAASLA